MSRSNYFLALLTIIAVGMIIGSLLQLLFIRRLDESSSGDSHWDNYREAMLLCIGFNLRFLSDSEGKNLHQYLNWSPRIILFHNFLRMEECDYLKEIARPRLEISTVVDTKTGKAIEKRIAVFSQVPQENGELIQALRYEANQYNRPHNDYFSDTFNLKCGGQRVATMLMYLNDDVEGGETYFPMAGISWKESA